MRRRVPVPTLPAPEVRAVVGFLAHARGQPVPVWVQSVSWGTGMLAASVRTGPTRGTACWLRLEHALGLARQYRGTHVVWVEAA